MKILKRKTNNSIQQKKAGNVVVTVVAFYFAFFVFCAFALDFAYVIIVRAKLQSATDATALVAAPYIKLGTAHNEAQTFFSYNKTNVLKHAEITDISEKEPQQAIKIETSCPAPTFFLNALGISYVTVQARSSAQIKTESMVIRNYFWPYHYDIESLSYIIDKPGVDFRITRRDDSNIHLVFVSLNEENWLLIPVSYASGEDYYYDLASVNVTAAKYLRVINVQYHYPFVIDFVVRDAAITNIAQIIKTSEYNSI